MYTHVSKCKNDKIKGEEKKEIINLTKNKVNQINPTFISLHGKSFLFLFKIFYLFLSRRQWGRFAVRHC
jgi:hypothetical protein